MAELNGSNEMVARYVYQSSGHVPDLVVRYDGPAPVRYRVVTDLRGSVLALVEVETGAVAQSFEYDAWGNILSQSGDPTLQPFRFAGGLYDDQTGLIRFGARDYDPRIGRWTAKDPIRWGGGQPNLYEYVSGDPVNWVDPSGFAMRIPESGPPVAPFSDTPNYPASMPGPKSIWLGMLCVGQSLVSTMWAISAEWERTWWQRTYVRWLTSEILELEVEIREHGACDGDLENLLYLKRQLELAREEFEGNLLGSLARPAAHGVGSTLLCAFIGRLPRMAAAVGRIVR